MMGTIVNSATELLQNRSMLIDQYPLPQPVSTTDAASKNELAKGAINTPNTTNVSTHRGRYQAYL
jgi:hypothetical protein